MRAFGRTAGRRLANSLGRTMAANDEKTRDDIERYGCTVINVLEEGELPPFAYSIGVTQKTGEPEVVVIGLKRELAHFIVNEYNRRVRGGERFESGQLYSGFVDGFDLLAEEVPLSEYDEYFGRGLRYYDGPRFRVLQLVYPSTAGVWPWSMEASESFRSRQPVLARSGRA